MPHTIPVIYAYMPVSPAPTANYIYDQGRSCFRPAKKSVRKFMQSESERGQSRALNFKEVNNLMNLATNRFIVLFSFLLLLLIIIISRRYVETE